jgi:Flp pilus assembly protein TadG
MLHSQKKVRQRARGVAMVEMAIVLPLVAIILAGLVDFGLALRRIEVLSNVARQAARSAAAYSLEDDKSPSSLTPFRCFWGAIRGQDCARSTSPNVQQSIECLTYREAVRGLESGGLDPVNWEVDTSTRQLPDEGGVQVNAVSIAIKRAAGSRSCLICYLGLVGLNLESSQSTFELEGQCL